MKDALTNDSSFIIHNSAFQELPVVLLDALG